MAISKGKGQMNEKNEQPANHVSEPSSGSQPNFSEQYGLQAREALVEVVNADLATGADALAQARAYAARGKPDFVLAYLLSSALDTTLSEADKRTLYALAHERRADYIERKAREFEQTYHRDFPLLYIEAKHDRALARQIRAG